MAKKDSVKKEARRGDLSRREVVVGGLSLAAAVGASAGAEAARVQVVEHDVQVKTPDGTCDAAFIHPTRGAHPAVILWPDAFGLRPTMREMGKRLAAEGYAVLVPNPYYRASPAASIDLNSKTFDFHNPDDMARLRKYMGGITPEGTEKDAAAFVAFLDAQRAVDRKRKMGTQGYCMGGPLVFRTAASQPDRIGAGASFHGGGLVTDQPTSPHLLIPKMKARMYVAIASNDDQRQPDAKDKLREAFESAHVPAEVEVYPDLHGWCVPDMPLQDGKPIYNKPDAERAWAKLIALYKQALG